MKSSTFVTFLSLFCFANIQGAAERKSNPDLIAADHPLLARYHSSYAQYKQYRELRGEENRNTAADAKQKFTNAWKELSTPGKIHLCQEYGRSISKHLKKANAAQNIVHARFWSDELLRNRNKIKVLKQFRAQEIAGLPYSFIEFQSRSAKTID